VGKEKKNEQGAGVLVTKRENSATQGGLQHIGRRGREEGISGEEERNKQRAENRDAYRIKKKYGSSFPTES